MASIRAGHQPVLLVVDVQVGVMADAWNAPRVIANVALAVERARSRRVPVLWVQHTSNELPTGSAPWQWVPELVPAPGEPVLAKRFNSSFEQTLLDAELDRLGASHIVLAGAATNWCIRATAYGALERGYDLTLVADAHATEPMVLDGGLTIPAEHIVQELNIAMTWLRYPGRRNGTCKAADLDFEAPAD